MTITQTYTTELPIPSLFEAWISPEMPVPPVVKIEVVPEVGGHFILHAQSEHDLSIMNGEFLKLILNQELKYTWNWEGSEETTIVSVDFIPGAEVNSIRVTQDGFLSEESKSLHASGWDHYFRELESLLTN
ncbi:MAG: SRPBCC family protein [Cyclobacteriaceae bacterium]